MRAFALLLGFLLAMPLKADIFRCTVNGHTSFSDQPCGEQAETIEIDKRQPDPHAVETQQTITRRFQEESRINQIHELKSRNNHLSVRIEQLQQDRHSELEQLRLRTYTTGDGRIATKEQGLFEKMDKLDTEYQQQIRDLKQQIQDNQRQIHQLYQ